MDRDLWDKLSDEEYMNFTKIPPQDKPSSYPDICAMLYLEQKYGASPNGQDMVSNAQHDIFWLNIDDDKVEKEMTEDDVVYLSRCGVHWDEYGLAMFT